MAATLATCRQLFRHSFSPLTDSEERDLVQQTMKNSIPITKYKSQRHPNPKPKCSNRNGQMIPKTLPQIILRHERIQKWINTQSQHRQAMQLAISSIPDRRAYQSHRQITRRHEKSKRVGKLLRIGRRRCWETGGEKCFLGSKKSTDAYERWNSSKNTGDVGQDPRLW